MDIRIYEANLKTDCTKVRTLDGRRTINQCEISVALVNSLLPALHNMSSAKFYFAPYSSASIYRIDDPASRHADGSISQSASNRDCRGSIVNLINC